MIVTLAMALLAAQTGTDAAAPKPEKKTCRSTQATGSRMGATRDCRTKAEWQALDRGRENDLTKSANDSLDTRGAGFGMDGPPGSTPR